MWTFDNLINLTAQDFFEDEFNKHLYNVFTKQLDQKAENLCKYISKEYYYLPREDETHVLLLNFRSQVLYFYLFISEHVTLRIEHKLPLRKGLNCVHWYGM